MSLELSGPTSLAKVSITTFAQIRKQKFRRIILYLEDPWLNIVKRGGAKPKLTNQLRKPGPSTAQGHQRFLERHLLCSPGAMRTLGEGLRSLQPQSTLDLEIVA